MNVQEPSILRRLSPIVCALFFGAVIAVSQTEGIPPEVVEQYNADVREAIDSTPYKVGEWIGRDEEIVSAATQLLKPNRILQRRYVNQITGQQLSLLIVHCGTIRDMGRHHPPVCYPAHGWSLIRSEPTSVPIRNVDQAARAYTFDKPATGSRLGMHVTNFFVLPTGREGIEDDLERLRGVGELRERNALGVAQVQIVTDLLMPEDERKAAIAAFIHSIEPVIETIEEGVE